MVFLLLHSSKCLSLLSLSFSLCLLLLFFFLQSRKSKCPNSSRSARWRTSSLEGLEESASSSQDIHWTPSKWLMRSHTPHCVRTHRDTQRHARCLSAVFRASSSCYCRELRLHEPFDPHSVCCVTQLSAGVMTHTSHLDALNARVLSSIFTALDLQCLVQLLSQYELIDNCFYIDDMSVNK